jgi:hypothetical protein
MLSYIKLTLLTHSEDEISSDHNDRDRQISVDTLRTEGKWIQTCTLNGYHTG